MILGSGIFRTKLPLGFKAGGINCGVRLYRPDLGVLISEQPATTVGVFTQNHCKAAPVTYCEHILPSQHIKAIITNSGEANAATGEQGVQDNQIMAQTLALALQCDPKQVLTASTGVIGRPLSLDKITAAIPTLVNKTSTIAEHFATAILTTDLVPKTVYKEIPLSSGTICITGICKGSGMIHPNMATMLGYLLTDVHLDINDAQLLLRNICDQSFNMISVDSETSTNDCVFLMSNGMSGATLDTPEDKQLFEEALLEISIALAKSIARDGEGASKLIEAQVSGTQDLHTARTIAKALITSPLIKTAIYGESPNWGRILARLGQAVPHANMLANCSIAIQSLLLFKQGAPVANLDLDVLKEQLKQEDILIQVTFQEGNTSATAWGCDLTEKYVSINAEYVS